MLKKAKYLRYEIKTLDLIDKKLSTAKEKEFYLRIKHLSVVWLSMKRNFRPSLSNEIGLKPEFRPYFHLNLPCIDV